MNHPLYVWFDKIKQVVLIDSSLANRVIQPISGNRYQTFDPNYNRWGTYMYRDTRWESGSWLSWDIADISQEFKTNLILLGVEIEN